MDQAWQAPPEMVAKAQVTRLAQELGCTDFAALHRYSVQQPDAFWKHMMGFLRIAW